MLRTVLAAIILAVVLAGSVAEGLAADLPRATEALIKQHPFLGEILKDSDTELALPAALVAKAKSEGEVKVVGTWANRKFSQFTKPFLERYPGVRISYTRGAKQDRGLKLLLAFKNGEYPDDVTISFGSYYLQMVKVGMFADLRDLPNFKNLPKPYRDDDGLWVGQKVTYRCMAYNTKAVAKKDLPKTWDDLVNSPRWRDGKLALNNYPHGWLLPLWGVYGETWAKDFAKKLFAMRPQLRKEGQTATVSLTAAGEFDAVVLAPAYRVLEYQKKGAPVSFHCPEPVPSGPVQMAVVKGSPREAAARVFVNWFLSREGQAAQWAADGEAPVHKDLQRAEFLAFPDQVLGKKPAYLWQRLVDKDGKKLSRFWKGLWRGENATAR